MRVLVTGHRGYLGSVMTCVLRHARFDVVGLDSNLFEGCDFGGTVDPVDAFDCDLRDLEVADLCSFDAVVHLAALSDDACAGFDPELAEEINVATTLHLARNCKEACVPRFLFASTCAVYGHGGDDLLDENSPLHPLSLFARTKLRCERELLRLADSSFSPVILRNAHVYGVSPRLRTDLLVNDFVASALTTGRITLHCAGRAWRPLIHVADLARAYAAVLTAPDDLVHAQVFNIARLRENYRIIDAADAVTDFVPMSTRHVLPAGLEQQSYRVDGSKLERTFPRLKFRWTLPVGIRQLLNAMNHAGMTPGQWRSDRYRRAFRLQTLLEQGELAPTLRRPVPVLV